MLAHADLSRYAGQFVWLEMNFDKPENQEFFNDFQASATPTFYVINAEGKVLADQPGGDVGGGTQIIPRPWSQCGT